MFDLVPKHVKNEFKKSFLEKHIWFHYLFHCSYCLFNDNITRKPIIKDSKLPHYKVFTPKEWLEYGSSFFEEKE